MIDESAIRELLAKQAITEVLYTYARGWDRLDEEALRSCFHPDSRHQHAGFEGLSADFIRFGLDVCQGVKSMTHLITNPLIVIKGDVAISECHYLAHHRRDRTDAESGEEDMFIKGRYIDRFEQRNGDWKIAFRSAFFDFERIVPPADKNLAGLPDIQVGHYKPKDALYAMLESI
jgi:hypothetical protein